MAGNSRRMRCDADLVTAVLAGDRGVFADLVVRYERPVRAAALAVLRDAHRAEDAAQEAFVRAFEKLASLRDPAAFGGWLLRITHRCAVNASRQRLDVAPLDEAAEPAAPAGGAVLDGELQPLTSAVMRLPDALRQVVLLYYFGDFDAATVAAITGRPIGTVTKQLSRAHRRLRTLLGEDSP